MSAVLVTGGTGDLGGKLVARLVDGGHTVRVLSRRQRPADADARLQWAQGDMETGQGLAGAVAGADLIIHAATGAAQRPRADVEGTRRLLEVARAAGTPHFFYVSIVGIDRIPLGYYKAKLACERLIEESGLPWSNLRATQFHSLIDRFLRILSRLPGLLILPGDVKFQPIDAGEVADRMVEYAARGPSGRLPDLGGPEVLTFGEMGREWLRIRGKRALVLPLPLFGRTAEGFRRGYNCTQDGEHGSITWSDWLARRYG